MLEIKNIEIKFNTELGETTAVKDFSFNVKKSEILAVVGESGSGKSVCALSITGLLKSKGALLTKGSILFQNKVIDYNNDEELQYLRGKDISYIFQEPMVSLNPLHKVGKQITERLIYVEGMKKSEAKAKAVELLSLCGVKNSIERINDYPHNFSGGERQRIMTAMALASNPKLLIADEPTTALDVTIQKQILDLLVELKNKFNMSIMLITHDLGIVKQYADRVVVVKKGLVIEQGLKDEIFNNPKEEYTKELINTKYGIPIEAKKNNFIIEVKDFSVKYPLVKKIFKKQEYFYAVKNINFALKEGDSLGIVGESGSGKTSLIKALLQLIDFEGKVVLKNKEFSSLKNEELRKMRRHIQIVFQDPFGSLNPRMTAGMIISEGLKAFSSATNKDIDKMVDEMLIKTGFNPEVKNRYPHEFSGGERQRIAIARAVIMKPDIIIFDEPTSSLDKNVQFQILSLLRELQKEYGLSYIFISHDLHVINSICNNIMVMRQGSIVEQGSRFDIMENPKHEYTKSLISAACL